MAAWPNDAATLSLLDATLLALPGVRKANAFGQPGYYVGKKLLACAIENCLTIKLPVERAAQLIADGAVEPFEPMGRTMRGWVLIRPITEEVLRLRKKWIEEALKYVTDVAEAAASGPAKPTRPKKAAPTGALAKPSVGAAASTKSKVRAPRKPVPPRKIKRGTARRP